MGKRLFLLLAAFGFGALTILPFQAKETSPSSCDSFGVQRFEGKKDAPLFSLKEIVVEGNSALPKEFLIRESGITPGLNLFQIQGREVRERLQKIPRIQWVEVRRRFPGTLHLSIKEKESIGRFNGTYEVSEKGELLEKRGDQNLPSIVGKDPEGIKEGVRFLQSLSHLPMDHLDVSNPQDLLLFLSPSRKVHLGKGDYEEKILHLKSLLEELNQKRVDFHSIDLRFNGHAVIR